MRNRFFTSALAVALAAGAFAGDNSKFTHYNFKDAATRQPASLAKLKGKYKAIYIDFFANWCGPCQAEIDKVIQLHNQYASKGVDFVGLDIGETWQAMQQDMKKKHINYTVLKDDASAQAGVLKVLGLQSIPVVIILDGKTLAEKGRWANGLDPSGNAERQQAKILASLGAR
jgi:thiol-disulfide isomerase/thioredoxin